MVSNESLRQSEIMQHIQSVSSNSPRRANNSKPDNDSDASDDGSSDEEESKRVSDTNARRASADLALLAGFRGNPSTSGRSFAKASKETFRPEAAANGPQAPSIEAPCLTPDGSESEPMSRQNSPQAAQSSVKKQSAESDMIATAGNAVDKMKVGAESSSGTGKAESSENPKNQASCDSPLRTGPAPDRKTIEFFLDGELAALSGMPQSNAEQETDKGSIETISFGPGHLDMTFGDGGLITSIRKGGVAHTAGVRTDWTIIRVHGQPVEGEDKDIVQQAFIIAKATGIIYDLKFRRPQ
jgi:hypothetical protein